MAHTQVRGARARGQLYNTQLQAVTHPDVPWRECEGIYAETGQKFRCVRARTVGGRRGTRTGVRLRGSQHTWRGGGNEQGGQLLRRCA